MTDVLNVAHRGARSLAPENTLAAARAGLLAGADMWETDVQVTADDQLIIMHDGELTRTSDARQRFPERGPWRVADFTLAEIQTLDCGSWFNATDPFGQIAAGHVSAAAQQSYRGEPAPTLRQALEFTAEHDWRVNVELKDVSGNERGRVLVEQTVGQVEAMGLQEQVILSSFNHGYLRMVRELNDRISTAAISHRAIRQPARYLAALGAQAYNPLWFAVRARTIRSLRLAGFDVFVWTVNTTRAMRRLKAAGVSGIITDFPQLLSSLQGKPYRLP